ncbi:uncharacterized protein FOMMEDRAFT_32466 [Fomitiporia mediterranea MF3/22]|uniref:Uncharacterized protein n=1 Tax=Fomitiporia mediterranea (strain MF3/22) TaxID=694068 RepID=R7SJ03_FOMME|nr:uncharacterized protein FOMMEDRAFT_32466 [Fomitiporia mediterranea MF3/22]EJC97599.1 hypothetical protein FOMMEDRAFT_32466 [Fomitiporia mediterranea MF3/22]
MTLTSAAEASPSVQTVSLLHMVRGLGEVVMTRKSGWSLQAVIVGKAAMAVKRIQGMVYVRYQRLEVNRRMTDPSSEYSAFAGSPPITQLVFYVLQVRRSLFTSCVRNSSLGASTTDVVSAELIVFRDCESNIKPTGREVDALDESSVGTVAGDSKTLGAKTQLLMEADIPFPSYGVLGVKLLGDVYDTLLATSEPRMESLSVRLLGAGVLSGTCAGGTASRAVQGFRVVIRPDEALKLLAVDTELGVGGSVTLLVVFALVEVGVAVELRAGTPKSLNRRGLGCSDNISLAPERIKDVSKLTDLDFSVLDDTGLYSIDVGEDGDDGVKGAVVIDGEDGDEGGGLLDTLDGVKKMEISPVSYSVYRALIAVLYSVDGILLLDRVGVPGKGCVRKILLSLPFSGICICILGLITILSIESLVTDLGGLVMVAESDDTDLS